MSGNRTQRSDNEQVDLTPTSSTSKLPIFVSSLLEKEDHNEHAREQVRVLHFLLFIQTKMLSDSVSPSSVSCKCIKCERGMQHEIKQQSEVCRPDQDPPCARARTAGSAQTTNWSQRTRVASSTISVIESARCDRRLACKRNPTHEELFLRQRVQKIGQNVGFIACFICTRTRMRSAERDVAHHAHALQALSSSLPQSANERLLKGDRSKIHSLSVRLQRPCLWTRFSASWLAAQLERLYWMLLMMIALASLPKQRVKAVQEDTPEMPIELGRKADRKCNAHTDQHLFWSFENSLALALSQNHSKRAKTTNNLSFVIKSKMRK